MKSLAKVLTLLVLFVVTASAQTWEPETAFEVQSRSSPRVSPDGKKVVYTVNDAGNDRGQSEFVTQIWLGDIATKRSISTDLRRQVFSQSLNGRPTETGSPFTSNRKDNKNNLYLLSMNGGEAEPLTDVKSGVANFQLVALTALYRFHDD
jgi:Tol biopolymer transport system component